MFAGPFTLYEVTKLLFLFCSRIFETVPGLLNALHVAQVVFRLHLVQLTIDADAT